MAPNSSEFPDVRLQYLLRQRNILQLRDRICGGIVEIIDENRHLPSAAAWRIAAWETGTIVRGCHRN